MIKDGDMILQPQAILDTSWMNLLIKDATWEDAQLINNTFTGLNLEGKIVVDREGNDRPPCRFQRVPKWILATWTEVES